MGLNRKRKSTKKLNELQNAELSFEKKPRISKNYSVKEEKNVKIINLLPIKASSGKIIRQSYEEQIVKQEPAEEKINETSAKSESRKIPKSLHDLMIRRRLMIENKKALVAHLSSAITCDPQVNYQMIKKLQSMLAEKNNSPESFITISKLVMVSLGCVFVDIIPGYRIRERTEKEKEVKLSKEVKALVNFETGLVSQFQLYLKYLEKMINFRQKPGDKRQVSSNATYSRLGEVAIRAMSELYMKAPHFNFHNNITVVLVPVANNDVDPAVRKTCCDAMSQLFGSDKNGAPTLQTVKAMAQVTKDQGPKKIRPEFLNTLLSLRIKMVDYSMIGVGVTKNKEDRKKAKLGKKNMSRNERKHEKKHKDLKQELKETAAMVDYDERTKTNTEIVQQIFLIYFRILKHKNGDSSECRKILPVVLKGLAKYAHLINIEFFGDLLNVLEKLVCSGTLTIRENLHCIFTVFQILSGQGEVLNVDPSQFYKIMYDIVQEMACENRKDEDLINVMLECIDMMLNKRRKQVTVTVLCAFIKRLSTLALQLHQTQQVEQVVSQIKKLVNSNSKTHAMFDTDSIASDMYDAEMQDPALSKSQSAILWDLHMFRRHYVLPLRRSAQQLMNMK